MTEQDRELLELAAKAAGYEIEEWDAWGFAQTKEQERWNPLVDDGDALRLAVKCGIDLVQFSAHVRCDVTGISDVYQMHEGDPYAATRRAIVRAAAEIGRSMT